MRKWNISNIISNDRKHVWQRNFKNFPCHKQVKCNFNKSFCIPNYFLLLAALYCHIDILRLMSVHVTDILGSFSVIFVAKIATKPEKLPLIFGI